jgi:hypothetical protein
MTLARETSFTSESGRKAGAAMWKICLPSRFDSREETVGDGAAFALEDLNPCGGLNVGGAKDEVEDDLSYFVSNCHD